MIGNSRIIRSLFLFYTSQVSAVWPFTLVPMESVRDAHSCSFPCANSEVMGQVITQTYAVREGLAIRASGGHRVEYQYFKPNQVG